MFNYGKGLLHLGFNQDSSCIACGSESGFSIYRCEPFREKISHKFNNGGIGIVEMLFRCNIFALVGGGTTPKFPPKKVMIWDEDQGRCIAELRFRNEILAVKLRKDRIVVAQEQKVSVYNFLDLSLLHTIETVKNPKGLVSVSSHPDNTVLACPGIQPGKIIVELYDRCKTKIITAHTTSLAALQLSLDGKLLASASETGTLIRIWNTDNGNLIQEVRRGTDAALIYGLSFSRENKWLGVSSDKGTVHIFALNAELPTYDIDENNAKNNQQNPTSVFNVVKNLVPLPQYFHSEWSFAQFRVPEGCIAHVGFSADENIFYVITSQGSLYKVSFDPEKGGNCSQISIVNFLCEK